MTTEKNHNESVEWVCVWLYDPCGRLVRHMLPADTIAPEMRPEPTVEQSPAPPLPVCHIGLNNPDTRVMT